MDSLEKLSVADPELASHQAKCERWRNEETRPKASHPVSIQQVKEYLDELHGIFSTIDEKGGDYSCGVSEWDVDPVVEEIYGELEDIDDYLLWCARSREKAEDFVEQCEQNTRDGVVPDLRELFKRIESGKKIFRGLVDVVNMANVPRRFYTVRVDKTPYVKFCRCMAQQYVLVSHHLDEECEKSE